MAGNNSAYYEDNRPWESNGDRYHRHTVEENARDPRQVDSQHYKGVVESAFDHRLLGDREVRATQNAQRRKSWREAGVDTGASGRRALHKHFDDAHSEGVVKHMTDSGSGARLTQYRTKEESVNAMMYCGPVIGDKSIPPIAINPNLAQFNTADPSHWWYRESIYDSPTRVGSLTSKRFNGNVWTLNFRLSLPGRSDVNSSVDYNSDQTWYMFTPKTDCGKGITSQYFGGKSKKSRKTKRSKNNKRKTNKRRR